MVSIWTHFGRREQGGAAMTREKSSSRALVDEQMQKLREKYDKQRELPLEMEENEKKGDENE